MGHLSRFLALPAQLQLLLAEASLLLVVYRITVVFIPFRRVQRVTLSLAGRKRGAAQSTAEIGWAVAAAGRQLRIGNCLAQALTAHLLLVRSDHDPDIRIGVARDDDGRFLAHAWVESNGVVVIGDEERGRFEPAVGPGRLA
jgi:hypothetical protein